MGKYFGTDGFRGKVNVELCPRHAYIIGRFLGWYFSASAKDAHKVRVAVGKDTRLSGDMLVGGLIAGLTASAADVYLLGVMTTPGVAFLTKHQEFDGGVMISASHNPFGDNGIKLFDCSGEKIRDDITALLETYLDSNIDDFPLAMGENVGRVIDFAEGKKYYVHHLTWIASHTYQNYRVGLDLANGATFEIAKCVFEKLGAHVYAMGDKPNGMNINEGVGSTHIEALQAWVVSNGLDVGFAFDGDGDRCLAVDANGQEVNGDHILYILGQYMADRGALLKQTIVSTVMSNMGLGKALGKIGLDLVQTRVGDRYVYENMVQNGYDLGGEQSGHIIIKKYATTGDGILTAVMLMEVMAQTHQPLSALASPVFMYPQVCISVPVKDQMQILQHPQVLAKQSEIIQALGDRGRLLLRPSGTEPVVRVMIEADSQSLCCDMAEDMKQVIVSVDWRGA